jgi:hypothetical protein
MALAWAAGVTVVFGLRARDGWGFVPGLLTTTPLAAVALVHGWKTSTSRFLLAIGLGALPLVWLLQFRGGAAPQWGGRYILPSGLLLATVGVCALPGLRRAGVSAFLVLSVCVTAGGVGWLSVRSHGVARAFETFAGAPEPVLVSRVAHLAREGGWFYGEKRWLTAVGQHDLQRAVAVVERAGFSSFGLVEEHSRDSVPPRSLGSFSRTSVRRVSFLGVPLDVATYERS